MPEPLTVREPIEPLLNHLFTSWPEVKKTKIRQWLKHGAVLVNGRSVTKHDHPLAAGDVVTVEIKKGPAPEDVLPPGLRIVFEDSSVIVIEKPSGLLSIASKAEREETAYVFLTEYVRQKQGEYGSHRGRDRIWIVHRLDRETSGLMVFARTEEAKHFLQENWDDFEKRYFAIVKGALPKMADTVRSHLDETNPFRVRSAPQSETTRHAITHYRVIKKSKDRSLVELELETGRRHQIRVHMADLGCPVLGDEKYNKGDKNAKRLALHSCHLGFTHPTNGTLMKFDSALPNELAKLM